MKKIIVVTLCLTSLLLQGCWTTMTKENPLYGDCSSYHNMSLSGNQQVHYVTVVSASARQCYGAGGGSVSHAKKTAMTTCKSNNHRDCVVYAENKKIVLSPIMKDRDMDWDSTFTLLTMGMAGAVAYEAGKSGGVPANGQYIPQTQAIPSYTDRPSIGALPSHVARNSVPPAGASAGAYAGSGDGAANNCVLIDRTNERHRTHGGVSYGNTMRNTCGFGIMVWYCYDDPAGKGFHSCQYKPLGDAGPHLSSAMLASGESEHMVNPLNPGKTIHYIACVDTGGFPPSGTGIKWVGGNLIGNVC